jgi:hypothetical protein
MGNSIIGCDGLGCTLDNATARLRFHPGTTFLTAALMRAVTTNRRHSIGARPEYQMQTLLIIILILVLLGTLPTWPYSRGWGYAPSGIVGVVVVIVLIMLLI